MKKILSFLLAALMMTALLVGCGQQQADAPGNDEPDQPALVAMSPSPLWRTAYTPPTSTPTAVCSTPTRPATARAC